MFNLLNIWLNLLISPEVRPVSLPDRTFEMANRKIAMWNFLKVYAVELELIVFIFFDISTTLLKLWLFDYNLECQTYQTLTSSKRKATWSSTSVVCDSSTSGWYRFTEGAGTKMPTTCVPMHRCNTHAPGWLNGNHPTVADGQVTRQVCFHWSSNCCNWSTNIQVRNCGEYFVYLLSGTPVCSLRYCGTD